MKETIITRARIFDSNESREYCIWAEQTTASRYMEDAAQAQALMNGSADVVAHLMVMKIEDGEVIDQYGQDFGGYAVNETKSLASEIQEAIQELGEENIFIGWYLTADGEYLLMDEDDGTPIMVSSRDREEATEATGINMGDDTAGLNSLLFLADLPTF